MKLYRIADMAFPIFDGGGALRASARWHTAGRRIIYCGPNLSCCRLELMANLGAAVLRKPYGFVIVDVPDDVSMETKTVEELPVNWDHPRDHSFTRPIGDAWYDARRTLLLRIPAVASPSEFNILVNQDHPDFARLTASSPEVIGWDERTFVTRNDP